MRAVELNGGGARTSSGRRDRLLAGLGVAATLLLTLLVLVGAHANTATAGLVFLIVVLVAATWAGVAVGIATALLAAACFNFFFIPPTGTFHVDDTSNWVALTTFLIAALLASRLMVAARREAEQARARAAEVEALYDLSVELFAAGNRADGVGAAAAHAVAATGAIEGGLALFEAPGVLNTPAWLGEPAAGQVRQRIESIRVHRQTLEFAAAEVRDLYLPLLVEGEPVGALVALRTRAARSALESAAQLLTLAAERSALLRDRAAMENLRQSEALKTALLRAVSHDLSTPLTAMGLQVDGLRRALEPRGVDPARLDALSEQLARLRRRIGNLLSLTRLEAGTVEPHPEPTPAADLFRAARESLPFPPGAREIRVEVAADCPDLLVDPSLALEILVNLIENAHNASPKGAPVHLTAERHPAQLAKVRLGVLDRGRGLPAFAHSREEIEAGDLLPRGLGLEIAKSLALASGGALRLGGRAGEGTCAWIDLPAAAGGVD